MAHWPACLSSFPWAHPHARCRPVRPMHSAAGPRVQQPPDTCTCQATPSRAPDITSEAPGLQELQALLTSGPGGDGLPGVGLVISGVIAVQIHPVVIRVDLGGCPVPLWSHLIGGTSWRLETVHKAVRSPLAPAPASPTTQEERWGSGHPPLHFTGKTPKGSGPRFYLRTSQHIYSPVPSFFVLKAVANVLPGQ